MSSIVEKIKDQNAHIYNNKSYLSKILGLNKKCPTFEEITNSVLQLKANLIGPKNLVIKYPYLESYNVLSTADHFISLPQYLKEGQIIYTHNYYTKDNKKWLEIYISSSTENIMIYKEESNLVDGYNIPISSYSSEGKTYMFMYMKSKGGIIILDIENNVFYDITPLSLTWVNQKLNGVVGNFLILMDPYNQSFKVFTIKPDLTLITHWESGFGITSRILNNSQSFGLSSNIFIQVEVGNNPYNSKEVVRVKIYNLEKKTLNVTQIYQKSDNNQYYKYYLSYKLEVIKCNEESFLINFYLWSTKISSSGNGEGFKYQSFCSLNTDKTNISFTTPEILWEVDNPIYDGLYWGGFETNNENIYSLNNNGYNLTLSKLPSGVYPNYKEGTENYPVYQNQNYYLVQL